MPGKLGDHIAEGLAVLAGCLVLGALLGSPALQVFGLVFSPFYVVIAYFEDDEGG